MDYLQPKKQKRREAWIDFLQIAIVCTGLLAMMYFTAAGNCIGHC